MSEPKALDAQLIGKVNEDAKKALGDTRARRKWGDSKSGSPVTTNMLCAEIARLNIALQQIVDATQSSVSAEAAANKASEIATAAMAH